MKGHLPNKSRTPLYAKIPIALPDMTAHTIRKCKKMAGQNTFEILHLNDANMIGGH